MFVGNIRHDRDAIWYAPHSVLRQRMARRFKHQPVNPLPFHPLEPLHQLTYRHVCHVVNLGFNVVADTVGYGRHESCFIPCLNEHLVDQKRRSGFAISTGNANNFHTAAREPIHTVPYDCFCQVAQRLNCLKQSFWQQFFDSVFYTHYL